MWMLHGIAQEHTKTVHLEVLEKKATIALTTDTSNNHQVLAKAWNL